MSVQDALMRAETVKRVEQATHEAAARAALAHQSEQARNTAYWASIEAFISAKKKQHLNPTKSAIDSDSESTPSKPGSETRSECGATTQTDYFRRIGPPICGVLLGIVIFGGAVALIGCVAGLGIVILGISPIALIATAALTAAGGALLLGMSSYRLHQARQQHAQGRGALPPAGARALESTLEVEAYEARGGASRPA
jgi:hypothetical protein